MIEKLKDYLNHLGVCLIYYFLPAITIYLINMSGKKSELKTDVIINNWELLKTIIFKNTLCFLWILTGVFLGQLVIKTFLIVNGCVMGIIISKLISLTQMLIILPHGIVEITSLIFICCIVTEIIKRKEFKKYEIIYLIITYMFIILAALIEAFFTTSLIKFL